MQTAKDINIPFKPLKRFLEMVTAGLTQQIISYECFNIIKQNKWAII